MAPPMTAGHRGTAHECEPDENGVCTICGQPVPEPEPEPTEEP